MKPNIPKSGITTSLTMLAALLAVSDSSAQPFPTIERSGPNEVAIRFPSTTNSYYGAQRTTNLSAGFQIDRLSLGSNGIGEFRFSTETSSASFFRIQEFPLPENPNLLSVFDGFDHDGDGIDDVWEMRHGLNPLASGDASQTVPGDGRTWLQFYRDQLPLIASFSAANSQLVETEGSVGIPVRFSKPFVGTLKFQVGGTAIESRDFQPGFSKPPGDPLAGTIPVNGSSVLIPLTLLTNDVVDPPRTLALSLRQLAPTNSYRAEGLPTHILTIAEADHGVYSGVMTFTNTSLVGSQRLKFAVRSTTPGMAVARFDTGNSLLFQTAFEIPCLIGPTGDFQFDPSAIVQGDLRGSAAVGRSVSWSLTTSATTPPDEATDLPGKASITLEFTGLAMGVMPPRLQGQLIYTRAD